MVIPLVVAGVNSVGVEDIISVLKLLMNEIYPPTSTAALSKEVLGKCLDTLFYSLTSQY